MLHPKQVVLVSCIDSTGKANVITLAWCMPASIHPPLLVISIAPKRYSHKLIEEAKEFVVNIPAMNLVKETLFCGRRTGRKHDKFKETQLTPLPAKIVQPPIIKECVAHLECRLHQQTTTGDHTLFIGEILAAYADEGIFDGKYNIHKTKPIYHMGGDDFTTLIPEITSPHIELNRNGK
ncbi:MAG: flavin reductase family protein [Candidatus Bathyarchaeota archaeon]|nr:MAG: flavin reductase family protein [Candidatus Bathyarchaeota archaeon]